MQHARLDGCFCNVFLSLSQSEKRGGHHQKVESETCAKVLYSNINRINGHIHMFLLVWELQELNDPEVEEHLGVGKETIVNMGRAATTVVGAGSSLYINVEQGWFNTYVGTELGKFRDCYIAHMTDRYKYSTDNGDILVKS